jgi:glycine cleavage system H protein
MRRYGLSYEWAERRGDEVTIGLHQEALSPLLPLSWVELPPVGSRVQRGDIAVVLESSKAAIDFASPLSGTVTEVNTSSVEKEGWFFCLKEIEEKEWEELREQPVFQEKDAP